MGSTKTIWYQVEVDGLAIVVREAGRRNAPTLVLLRGDLSSSGPCEALLPLLADRYHVIAPDDPGSGQGDAPPPSRCADTSDRLALTVAGAVERLGIRHLAPFPQDCGGPVGLRMAVAHAIRVSATVIQSANTYEEGLGAKWQDIARF